MPASNLYAKLSEHIFACCFEMLKEKKSSIFNKKNASKVQVHFILLYLSFQGNTGNTG